MDEDLLVRLWQEDYDDYIEEFGQAPINTTTGEALSVAEFALDVGDVWKNSYSENTNQKIWAAKYAARHPNLVALELSSFKCGHDAPIYTVIEEIVETSGTPYFSFKDIDENKPTGSIKIRTETIGYFLKRYQEDLQREKGKRTRIAEKMQQYQAELLAKLEAVHAAASEDERMSVSCLLSPPLLASHFARKG